MLSFQCEFDGTFAPDDLAHPERSQGLRRIHGIVLPRLHNPFQPRAGAYLVHIDIYIVGDVLVDVGFVHRLGVEQVEIGEPDDRERILPD